MVVRFPVLKVTKLKITIILICMFGCAVTHSRGYGDTRTNAVVAARNLVSDGWYPPLKQYAHWNALYGGSVLDDVDMDFLLRLTFPKAGALEHSQVHWMTNSFRKLVSTLRANKRGEHQLREYLAQAVNHNSQDLNETFAREFVRTFVLCLCPLTVDQLVQHKGDISITNDEVCADLAYQLITDQRTDLQCVSAFARSNPQLLPFLLDALKFTEKRSEYLPVAKELVTKGPLDANMVQCAELGAFLDEKHALQLVNSIFGRLPQNTNTNGTVLYVLGTETLVGAIYRALKVTLANLKAKQAYLQYQKRNDVIKYFGEYRPLPACEDYKGWLLYRYHPALLLDLLKQYQESRDLAVYRTSELRNTIESAIELALICPRSSFALAEAKSRIRDMAFRSKEHITAVNGLFLLETFASEQDIPNLEAACHDTTELSWRDGDRLLTGPLVAYRALHCLKRIGTQVSRNRLTKLLASRELDDRIRKGIKQILEEPQERKAP